MRRFDAAVAPAATLRRKRTDRTVTAEHTERKHAPGQDCSNARSARRLAPALGLDGLVLAAAPAALPLAATEFLVDARGRIVRLHDGRTDFDDLERRIAAERAG